ncbi:MAG TPA: hypothetical protein PLO69_05200 [Gammaproteobacteria bacterium]|nr:hypothetical protein [Gammaproteobacteria bacterium]
MSLTEPPDQEFLGLLERPQDFTQDAFERLVERFRHRLTIDDILTITARRIRARSGDTLEKRTILSIIDGRFEEAERLFAVLDRKNSLRLCVISSPEPTSLPQSCEEEISRRR